VPYTGALACERKLQRILAGQDHNHKPKFCQKLFQVELGGAPPQLQKRHSSFQFQLPAPKPLWKHR